MINRRPVPSGDLFNRLTKLVEKSVSLINPPFSHRPIEVIRDINARNRIQKSHRPFLRFSQFPQE